MHLLYSLSFPKHDWTLLIKAVVVENKTQFYIYSVKFKYFISIVKFLAKFKIGNLSPNQIPSKHSLNYKHDYTYIFNKKT